MNEAPQPTQPIAPPTKSSFVQPHPWQCLIGSVTASGIALVLYNLTTAIAAIFANQKSHSSNLIVQRITAAVRTMFVGMSALGTGIFALAALGLLGLGLQLLFQKKTNSSE
jgi:hypothetical protein